MSSVLIGRGHRVLLSPVYHWSPIENRKAILQEGLKIGMADIRYTNPVSKKEETWVIPYICTSIDPLIAWNYFSAKYEDDPPPADLYEVRVLPEDSARIRNDGSPSIVEVRLENTIPPDRVRYIATREGEIL